jgi:GT2 family glycosyltransferase
VSGPRKIVLLGMMTKMPVAGVVWQTLHYLLGLRGLGFDPYYVEAHARTPSMLMHYPGDDGTARAAEFIDGVMRRFDLADHWAYHALHDDGRCYGTSKHRLIALYDSAELIVNLHGGTAPRPEHVRGGRLVYVETDPVQLQAELHTDRAETIDFLEQHCAYFTFGENWGAPDCGMPPTSRFDFRPTRQPVFIDLWPVAKAAGSGRFTTIGNWRQRWRDVELDGRTYTWSKNVEFERFLALPRRTGREFELALAAVEPSDRELLEDHGWRVSDAVAVSGDIDSYRDYISSSLGEFTVAKEQNAALRSGWFSDRSATYLAAGRPVITQETGFSNVLPTGCGLHAFATIEEAAAAVEKVLGAYERERRRARELAEEHFRSDAVLKGMLDTMGVSVRGTAKPGAALTEALVLMPVSRRPLRLPETTVRAVTDAPLPFQASIPAAPPVASVAVVSYDNFVATRMCVESLLANTSEPPFELIVIDNGSRDGSRAFLRTIERRFANVRLILNDANRGFAAACNQGLAVAAGELLVLLNNDAIVAPGWLADLRRAAADESVGLIGAVTNRIGNEAEVAVEYTTYGGFIEAAAARARAFAGESFEIPMPAMFCLAMRAEVYDRIGPIDERFGPALLEDDDYAERARKSGLRCICCEGVLVHHFGEGSLGRLFEDGAYAELLERNRGAFADKWGRPWEPYGRRTAADYEALRTRVRETVGRRLPALSAVIVASRGDDELLRFEGREGWHFPQTAEGVYAGHYPADSHDAIEQLERLRAKGGDYLLLPRTSLWWLDYYRGLRLHLNERYREVLNDDDCLVYALRGEQ